MATVIYSNFGDPDTRVLTGLWAGLDDVNVVEITPDTKDPRKIVDEAIRQEEELLILCGHGSPNGLYTPDFSLRFLIDECNAKYIKARKVVGVWCFASSFAEANGLKGFFTDMFISNINEARLFGVPAWDSAAITRNERKFCKDVCSLVHSDVPMDVWIDSLKENADMDDPVVNYNYNGLACYS